MVREKTGFTGTMFRSGAILRGGQGPLPFKSLAPPGPKTFYIHLYSPKTVANNEKRRKNTFLVIFVADIEFNCRPNNKFLKAYIWLILTVEHNDKWDKMVDRLSLIHI